MKLYIRASITSEVNDIVNSKKDVKYDEHYESRWTEEDLKWFAEKNNIKDFDIIKLEPDDSDYQKYSSGLNIKDYPKPYYVLKWITEYKYNATRTEELNAILKRIKTFDELQELYHAVWDTGMGIWFYTKRNNNPLNGPFEPVPHDPESVTYIVDRHSAVLKCKISNLYKVLKIY